MGVVELSDPMLANMADRKRLLTVSAKGCLKHTTLLKRDRLVIDLYLTNAHHAITPFFINPPIPKILHPPLKCQPNL